MKEYKTIEREVKPRFKVGDEVILTNDYGQEKQDKVTKVEKLNDKAYMYWIGETWFGDGQNARLVPTEEEMDYFEKLKQLPCEAVKESGRLTGNYALRISISGGIWFLEYVYDGELFSEYEEAVYPFRCSGNNLEEIIDKAFSFFDNNFGKYKLIKY